MEILNFFLYFAINFFKKNYVSVEISKKTYDGF